jgi:hypothetical protein
MGYNVRRKITFGELLNNLKKGVRKGNWRKLNWRQRTLYRTAMEYTRPKKKGESGREIVGKMLLEKLLALIEKLMETSGMRVFKRGQKKADEILQKGEENGLFAWAPRLRNWLSDSRYIFWLGTVRW